MAEIPVERKPRSSLPLIVGILLLAVVAFVVWRYMSAHPSAGASAPAVADTTAR